MGDDVKLYTREELDAFDTRVGIGPLKRQRVLLANDLTRLLATARAGLEDRERLERLLEIALSE